tara:strand:+ start:137 stop:658 length:522 start_codon:yes stop_codon:yes gene_type:complete
LIETDKISLAASWIKEKKIIAYPTEGVWGIGCINNESVISKLSEIKQRPEDKKYILLFKSVDDLRKKFDVKKDYIKQIKELSKSFTTIIVPLNENNSIAVRIPKIEILHDLLEEVGEEIVSTSANISSLSVCKNVEQINTVFSNKIFGILNLPLGGENRSSRIYDLKTDTYVR